MLVSVTLSSAVAVAQLPNPLVARVVPEARVAAAPMKERRPRNVLLSGFTVVKVND
jgi:hypothetical protein